MSSGIKYTCPDIDDLIQRLSDCCKNCEEAVTYIEKEKYDDAKSELNNAIWFLEDFKRRNNVLEDLRASNISLRDYGDDQYKRAEELEEQIEELQQN